jgi:hypothetical protein
VVLRTTSARRADPGVGNYVNDAWGIT